MLPDVALLEIFDFYVSDEDASTATWYKLVHVCQKWRNVVFGSPRRLDLRLACSTKSPVRKTLDVWPPLPIAINVVRFDVCVMDDIVAALEPNDRICQVDLDIPSSQGKDWEEVLAAMQQPFPALTHLDIAFPWKYSMVAALPASFLGGSTPHLQYLAS